MVPTSQKHASQGIADRQNIKAGDGDSVPNHLL